MSTVRTFAIVPAAGRSQRMGQAKLLLPWGRHTIIEQVLAAWRASQVDKVVVVTHPDDAILADVCKHAGAEVVVAEIPPPDMKASVLLGLVHIRQFYAPQAHDAWLVAPADLPLLSSAAIDAAIAAHDPTQPRIVVPVDTTGNHGHPVLFPWPMAVEVASLAEDAGLKALLQSHELRTVALPGGVDAPDVDTPDEYRRLRDRYDRRD